MRISLILFFLLNLFSGWAQQNRSLSGIIYADGEPLPFANVYVTDSNTGTSADANGFYKLEVPDNASRLSVSAVGFKTHYYNLSPADFEKEHLNFTLIPDLLGLEEVVVSATRNRLSKKEAPVIVQVMSPKLFRATQSLSLADGLNYQPGLRVETNCQNCGFTQVRLNGLDGQYTQVLLNSRPVFSALNGVYGLEQIPVSIIDRVEVVRSGGSALYGSSAIAGTVNIITKDPVNNSWEVSSNLGLIDGTAIDRNLNLNTSLVSEDLSNGITLYGMYRNRDAYDANGDGFSEITELTNHSVGAKAFYRPNDNSKISLDLTAIREYRRGGDRLDLAPQFTDITEELDHNTFFGGSDYEWYNNDRSTVFEGYVSVQHTNRESYYGGLGGGRTAADSTLASNAFGSTQDLALVTGTQLTRKFTNKSTLTSGLEYRLNDTEDAIPGYQRLVDQRVHNLGAYAQWEYKAFEDFTALLGARLDHVNVKGRYAIAQISRNADVSQTVLSPRLTLLYNISESLQFRGGYARGFRAPQAFNEDLHISSVGGEQRFAILSDDLENEFSNAYTASFNFDRSFNKLQTSLLIEGFYTTLENPFTLVSTGATLPNGSILEESRNGSGASVAGTNVEFNLSPGEEFLFQAGITWQRSVYDRPQVLFESDDNSLNEPDVVIHDFMRSPILYGFFNANWRTNEAFKIDLSGSFTGPMLAPHVISSSGFIKIEKTPAFLDLTPKLTWHFDLQKYLHLELSGGVQNLLNSYQTDFDRGPLRDSNYIYGPNRPRTFFIGLRFGDF
ncbi:TonB-dependent receptor [Leeuwenhoekiella parthenopeia]|uniref:TonB-dependent receptor n=1 Tax=Leeuwenhoekiella parthenopeia TaxID=2890320 RepID=A0ABS8GMV8_9FLAO|nr:TonB-dependent receptor [Leeuwenhoekiella parthenopeia]MCC4211319.1 TonB-dependent receptor [Leeuwenhoekiella parthenopeia]